MTTAGHYRQKPRTRKALWTSMATVLTTAVLLFSCVRFAAGRATVVTGSEISGKTRHVGDGGNVPGPWISVATGTTAVDASDTTDVRQVTLLRRFIVPPHRSRPGKNALKRHSVAQVENPSPLMIADRSFRDDYDEANGYASADDVSAGNVTYRKNRRPNYRQMNRHLHDDDPSTVYRTHVPPLVVQIKDVSTSEHSYSDVGKTSGNISDSPAGSAAVGSRPEQVVVVGGPAPTTDGNVKIDPLNDHFRSADPYYSLAYTAGVRGPPSETRQVTTDGRPLNKYQSSTYGVYYGTQPIPEPPGGVVQQIGETAAAINSGLQQSSTTGGGLPSVLNSVQEEFGTVPGRQRNRLSWRRIAAILALLKIGLLQLKALGLLRILFLVLLKLKIFLLALLVKFFFLLKSLMLFKLMIAPVLLLPLLLLPVMIASMTMTHHSTAYTTALAALPSMPAKIANAIFGTQQVAAAASSPSPSSVQATGGNSNRPTLQRDTAEAPSTDDTFSQTDNFDFAGGRRFPDRAASIYFLKALDSGKCLERIACELALRARTSSSSIDRIADQISKQISFDKFALYLKTYDKVSKEMHNISPTQEDTRGTWCLEHYDCNSINSTDVRH